MHRATQEMSRGTGTRNTAPISSGPDGRQARRTRASRTLGATLGIVVVTAALAAGGLTAVRLIGTAQGNGNASAGAAAAAGQSGGKALDLAAQSMLQRATAPRVATMPAHAAARGARVTGKPTPAGSGRAPSAGSTSPDTGQASSQPTAPGSAAPTTQAPAGSPTCTDPQYTTSDPTGMWNLSPYFVANDMWGISGYTVSQTLSACSYSNWYVVANMNNDSGDGHVKTYPNSHRDFDSEPEISSFSSITSTFAETDPGTGIYEDAYDIWLNGIASSTSTEVMIWTNNHGQTPAGSVQTTVTIDGRSYTVYKTTGNYIAFVANSNFTSGTMNLLDFFQWITGKGWLASDATLGQVDYGAELVSTDNVPETFTFSNFSVNAS